MPITGRAKPALVVTDDERSALLRLTKRPRTNRLLAFRARLVLACADGAANTAVARRYRTTDATVGKWRQRFIDRRLDGIDDEPRVGAPRTISDEDVEAVIVKTLETTPAGETYWRDLERFGDVRLEVKRAPDPADGRMAHPGVREHGPSTPIARS
jgi:transposase-like protein